MHNFVTLFESALNTDSTAIFDDAMGALFNIVEERPEASENVFRLLVRAKTKCDARIASNCADYCRMDNLLAGTP